MLRTLARFPAEGGRNGPDERPRRPMPQSHKSNALLRIYQRGTRTWVCGSDAWLDWHNNIDGGSDAVIPTDAPQSKEHAKHAATIAVSSERCTITMGVC